MRCQNCGFVYSRDVDECPYCGQKNKTVESPFSKPLKINSDFSIKRSTLINIVVFNVLIIAFFLDAIGFRFSYGITVLTYSVAYGFILIVSIFIHKNNGVLSNYFRIDIYLFFFLSFAYLTLGENFALGNLRPLIASIIAPIYFIVATISLVFILAFTKPKIHFLEFVLVMPLRLILASIVFALLLISLFNGNDFPLLFYKASSYPWQCFDIYLAVSRVLVIGAFAITGLVTLNFTIYWILRTASMVHYTYGK